MLMIHQLESTLNSFQKQKYGHLAASKNFHTVEFNMKMWLLHQSHKIHTNLHASKKKEKKLSNMALKSTDMNFPAKCIQIRLCSMEAPWNNLHKCVQVNQCPVPLLLRPDLMMGSPSCPSHGSGHKNKGRSDTMQMNPNRKKKKKKRGWLCVPLVQFNMRLSCWLWHCVDWGAGDVDSNRQWH